MWHAWAKKDEVSFLLQSDLSIREEQNEMTAYEDIECLDGVARRPFTARLALRVGVPLQLQLRGSKWVVITPHEMAKKPTAGVL